MDVRAARAEDTVREEAAALCDAQLEPNWRKKMLLVAVKTYQVTRY